MPEDVAKAEKILTTDGQMNTDFFEMKLFFKILLLLVTVLVVSAVILDFRIRRERNLLQARAKEFLSRPVPTMFQTNEIGGFDAGPNQTVLSISHSISERYAKNGRIRQTSAISAQMALSNFEIAFCTDAAKTNKDALIYIEDYKAIRDEEWRMGARQGIEDLIELRIRIPEIEEEDFKLSATTNSVFIRVNQCPSVVKKII